MTLPEFVPALQIARRFLQFSTLRPLRIWRSGFSAESRIHDFVGKYGGLPTAATIDWEFCRGLTLSKRVASGLCPDKFASFPATGRTRQLCKCGFAEVSHY